ncbi:MAG: serine/threonine-protein kinase, partial [Polyangiaceae bacterium]
GLHAAHEENDPEGNPAGIVHRDVSPSNILVSRAGVAKVIDFGIAKAVNRGSEETRTGLMKGKLRYMAPEQATRGDVDRRADVWSMGAVIYGLMNGAPPFEESGDIQIIARLVKGVGPEPLSANVPTVVRAIVEKAMSIDRESRYGSTLELAHALEAVMISTAATATAGDVAAFCAAEHARDAGDAIPSSRPPEAKAELAAVVPEPRRRWQRGALMVAALSLGAVGAFVLLRGDAPRTDAKPDAAPATEAPLPPPVTTPTAAATPEPPVLPPSSTSTSSSAAPVIRPPIRTRPKPRQKR